MSQRPHFIQHTWQGVYTADFTIAGVEQRCRWLAATLVANKWSCLIAFDTRFMAGLYARYVYLFLEARGVQVSFCPTPAPFPTVQLALEQRRADTALIISADNQQFWYCGMIVLAPPTNLPLLQGGPVDPGADEPVIAFPPPTLDSVERTQIDLRAPYLESLRAMIDVELIRRATLTVFVDPMNGTTSGYIPAAIGEGGQTKAIEINREVDPLFARQTPQPVEANLQRLRKLVKESDSHLGVALSADGRALSVTDSTGELITPTELALLLGQYLVRTHRQRGTVVVPALADEVPFRNWEQATGIKVEALVDPGPRIAALLAHDRGSLLTGVTPMGELSLGRSSVAPDAAAAAMLLIELVARSGGKLRAQVDELRATMRVANTSKPKS